jgi:hypothetical protein
MNINECCDAKECTTQRNGVKPERVAVLERRRLGFSVKMKVEDKKGHPK